MTHSPHQNTPDPGRLHPLLPPSKLGHIRFYEKTRALCRPPGKPVVRQLYALYYLWESEHTPKRAKMIIVGALVYFLSPIDSIPDLLIPFGFSDDIAVIALVYSQMKKLSDPKIFKKKPVKRLTSCLVLNWIQFDYTYIKYV